MELNIINLNTLIGRPHALTMQHINQIGWRFRNLCQKHAFFQNAKTAEFFHELEEFPPNTAPKEKWFFLLDLLENLKENQCAFAMTIVKMFAEAFQVQIYIPQSDCISEEDFNFKDLICEFRQTVINHFKEQFAPKNPTITRSLK